MRLTTAVVVMSITVLGGCASRGFVDDRVGQVEARVSDQIETQVGVQIRELRRDVDESSATVRQQWIQLAEVDLAAQNAFTVATAAQTAATELSDTLMSSNRGLGVEVVIADNHDQFASADAQLPASARATLSEFVEMLRGLPAASHLEIEGHTDATGSPAFNARLGKERASNVRRYLHEEHEIPLQMMSIISYGEDQPMAPNDTAEGRAQNRRVVIRVLR